MEDLSDKNTYLLRIARHLMLYSSSGGELGLYHGKMGIVLFFVYYSRYTEKEMYTDYAREILNDIVEKIHQNMNYSFEFGLCGIGWGVAHLIENNFMEGDPDELLSDIDLKVMEYNLKQIKDVSVDQGVLGIGYYIESRIRNKTTENSVFREDFLSDWFSLRETYPVPTDLDILLSICRDITYHDHLRNYPRLGLHNGCAGYALKQIIETESIHIINSPT